MSQVWVQPTRRASWMWVAAAVLLLGALAMWWGSSPGSASDVRGPKAGSSASAQGVPATGSLNADNAGLPAIDGPHDLQMSTVQAQQAQAAEALARWQPGPQSADVITERPDYVSPLEWLMIKGVAQRHAQPGHEVTRLVHFLRFNKQLELWQGLAGDADSVRRQSLASELLSALPERIRHGDLALKDAGDLVPALVQDAVTDPQMRAAQVALHLTRLQAAVPPASASGAHP